METIGKPYIIRDEQAEGVEQLREGEKHQQQLNAQDVQRQHQGVLDEKVVVGEIPGQQWKQCQRPGQVIFERRQEPLRRIDEPVGQYHDQGDDGDHRDRIHHGAGQPRPADTGQAADQFDMRQVQEDRDEQPDVEDVTAQVGYG